MKDYYVFNFIELKEDALINNITKVLCRLGKKLINKLVSNGKLKLKDAQKYSNLFNEQNNKMSIITYNTIDHTLDYLGAKVL